VIWCSVIHGIFTFIIFVIHNSYKYYKGIIKNEKSKLLGCDLNIGKYTEKGINYYHSI